MRAERQLCVVLECWIAQAFGGGVWAWQHSLQIPSIVTVCLSAVEADASPGRRRLPGIDFLFICFAFITKQENRRTEAIDSKAALARGVDARASSPA